MLGLGDTILLPKPGQPVSHLWAIVTDLDARTGEVVIVNLTTQRPHSDPTVLLNVGDHPFVKHPTVVNFSDARFVKLTFLDQAIQSGRWSSLEPLSPALIARIQQGLVSSPHTPNKIKDRVRRPGSQGGSAPGTSPK
jgi:hypothetical protein